MKKRTKLQNARLHRLLSLCNINDDVKKVLVSSWTNGRTDSSAEMSEVECRDLISHLHGIDKDRHGKSRGKVQNLLRLLGWEWKKIDNFIINIGSNNPKRKSLNNLGGAELNAVVTQVEALYQKETNRYVKGKDNAKGGN